MTTGAHLATAGGSWRAARPFVGGVWMIAGWLDAVGGVGSSAPSAASAGKTSGHGAGRGDNAENEDRIRFNWEDET